MDNSINLGELSMRIPTLFSVIVATSLTTKVNPTLSETDFMNSSEKMTRFESVSNCSKLLLHVDDSEMPAGGWIDNIPTWI